MAAREQRVRLHFLVALTLVVIAFGVSNVVRNLRREQERAGYERTEQELTRYLTETLREEQVRIEDFAREERGRMSRDAAALLAQVRHLLYVSGQGRPAAGASSIFERIQANFERLKAGQPAIFPRGRSFLRAFYSPTDGGFRPYSLCLPAGYSADNPIPVVLNLGSDAASSPWQDVGTDCYVGALSAKPEFACAGHCPLLGEAEALGMLDELESLYYIDPRRRYLVGEGAGTTRAWHLAVRYPDSFAGVVALGSDSVYSPPERKVVTAPLPTVQQDEMTTFLRASLLPLSYAGNMRLCHAVVAQAAPKEPGAHLHGTAMARRLQELDCDVEYLQFPGVTGERLPDWVREYAMGRVFGAHPIEAPETVFYKTADLRHNEAWWLRIERIDDPLAFATVEGEQSGGDIAVRTDNVTALTILCRRLPRPATGVAVDGQRVPAVTDRNAITLVRRAGRWQSVQALRPGKGRGRSGPVTDVLRDPFLLVYGTTGESDLLKNISRREVERFARYREQRTGSRPRVKADTDVSDADIKRFNLLLFGGPMVNALTARVAGGLPVRFQPDAIELGGQRYAGEDTGVILCYPNPEVNERMIAVVAGVGPAGLYQAYDRFGTWFGRLAYDRYKWFDYAVFDSRSIGPGSFLAVGFFTNSWDVMDPDAGRGDGGASLTADPQLVERLRPQGFPRLLSVEEAEGRRVALSDVMPLIIEQPRGAVGFDRSFAGRPIRLGEREFEKGLGVQAPSELTYGLDGRFTTFEAVVGPTPGFRMGAAPTREGTPFIFEVRGDGEIIASVHGTLGRPESGEAQRIAADVTGVRTLTLKVTTVDSAQVSEAFAWGEPTLTR